MKTEIPQGFRGSTVDVSRDSVRLLFSKMKRQSGPGHPWVGLAPTKGAIIDNHSEMLIDAVLDTLRAWTSEPEGQLPEDAVDLIRGGYSAPMRVFVKAEPHGLDKVAQKRWRIIVMVPIHIVLAEMLIFGTQNEEEINHWDSIPSKPGLGLADDAHIRSILEEVKTKGVNGVAEADVSGYDFSLCDQFFQYDARRRVRLAGAEEGSLFSRAVYNAHHVLNRAVFALSDGKMYAQLKPGVMKSGRYVTSSTNSFIRVLLAHGIGARWCIAMGDDSLEDPVLEAAAKYKKLGVNVKFYTICDDAFEFCSHTFTDGVAYPSKPGKMLYNLLSQNGDFTKKFMLIQQWGFEMRHHPDLDSWEDAITRCEWVTQNDGNQETEIEA